MATGQSNNKVIFVNTAFLYIRMLFVLLITLATTRELLRVVGIEDYGIINLISGVVALFSFLNNALVSSTQRFLNYYIAKGDLSDVNQIFKASMICHIIIALVIIVLGETIGLWFVNKQLNIVPEKYFQVNILYHISLIITSISVIRVPYNATFIAYEKMGYYAVLSILEALLKLLLVYLLLLSKQKLIAYAILSLSVTAIIFLLYVGICKRNFKTVKLQGLFKTRISLLKEQLSFSGWYLLGGSAVVGTNQGINIILNIFYGVTLNAAVGIAHQVRSGVYSFVGSFQTAFNPQIVKLYANKEPALLSKLIIDSTRISFFLLFIISFPIIVFCPHILAVWLDTVPGYSIIFSQLAILTCYIDALSAPLWTLVGAAGKVKKYQIIVSSILILALPTTYLLLTWFRVPSLSFVSVFIFYLFAYIFRIYYGLKYVKIPFLDYYRKIILPIIAISLCCVAICLIMNYLLAQYNFAFSFIVDIVICITVIIFLGLSSEERTKLVTLVKSKLKK